jgi:hypothetical protein
MTKQDWSREQGGFPAQMKLQADVIVEYDDDSVPQIVGESSRIDNIEYTPGVELGDFFRRPVLVGSFDWLESTPFNTNFYPWNAYFNDARVKKKLDNFSLISCNLKLKVMISASPFYYGCAIMAYQPIPSFTPATDANVSSFQDDLMPISQKPHLWIYPQNSDGGEFTLPFFYPKNWLRLTKGSDFTEMGTITLREYAKLSSANGVTGTGVSIQVYAWAEDVKMTAPTSALALQSDEYATDGVISKPASAIASIANKLSSVPAIGSYMRATSVVASAVASVAAWFGFTNVPVISDVMPFKSLPFHAFSSSEIGAPIDKMSLDPKNELSIDPKIVGVGSSEDELSIAYIVQRESFVDKYSWSTADAPNTLICGSQVLPEICRANGVWRNSVPMAHLQHMFGYWRGDIIFRFKFICSQYHKGRARITWDPDGDLISNTTTSTVCFTKIVDISSCSDVEIRIPYMQAIPWLRTKTSLQTQYFGDSTFTYSRDPLQDNGALTVRVFTKLSSPVATSDVKILMFVRGAENLEFAFPKDVPTNLSLMNLQSDEKVSYDSVDRINIVPTPQDDPNRYLVNFGERIVSLRQVLRRTTLSRISHLTSNVTASKLLCRFARRRYPLCYGYDSFGIDSAKGTLIPANDYAFNFVQNTPFNWIGSLFIGMRGSSIWQYNVEGNDVLGSIRVVKRVETVVPAEYKVTNNIAIGSNSNTISRFGLTTMASGGGGSSLTNQLTQSGVSVLMPNFNQYKMMSTDPLIRTIGDARDGSDIDHVRLEIMLNPSSQGTDPSASLLHEYHSIGTDFTFIKFINVPSMRVLILPAAT